MDKCAVCTHPRMAHDAQPKPAICVNCAPDKKTKLRAQHTFRTQEEVETLG
jgi:hypothetical protein